MIGGAVVLLVIALVYCTVTDLRFRRIPNKVTFPILIGGLILRAVVGGQAVFVVGSVGMVAALALMVVPFAMGWVGAGDVKLAAVVGALMGPNFVFAALLFAAIFAGVFALIDICWKRQLAATVKYLFFSWFVPAPKATALKGRLPYAPALAGGCVVMLFLAAFTGVS